MPAPDRPAPPTLRLYERLADLEPAAWNALVEPDNTFLQHGVLNSFEAAGCVGPGRPWAPQHAVLRDDAGAIRAAAPLYLKHDSYGEFVFDWAWAEAYQRAGLAYYPKAVVAVPFTPATGGRFLVAPDAEPNAAIGAWGKAVRAALPPDITGLHVLFATAAEQQALAAAGFMPRLGYQFHWFNRGYRDFADFLDDLRSKKRKQILRERAAVSAAGVSIHVLQGEAIEPAHVEAMWRFYQDTGRRKWGTPYLNRAWFDHVHRHLRERLLLVLGHDGRDWVGGTMNFVGDGVLYGRYWGADRAVDALHFECCYYRLIEEAIARGLHRVEAGAQGEHKFLRGFVAVPTYSAHWLRLPQGAEAIERFLAAERREVERLLVGYNGQSPLKWARAAAAEGAVDLAPAAAERPGL